MYPSTSPHEWTDAAKCGAVLGTRITSAGRARFATILHIPGPGDSLLIIEAFCTSCQRNVTIESDATAFCPVCSSPLIQTGAAPAS